MGKLLAALFCISLLATGGGCVPAEPVTSPIQAGLTVRKVRMAIAAAALALKWTVTPIDEGTIEASILVRGHGLVVVITYTETEYTIKYKGSSGMIYNEKNQTIGRQYKRWVRNLDVRIQRELLVASLGVQ